MIALFAAFYFGFTFCYYYGKRFLCCNPVTRVR